MVKKLPTMWETRVWSLGREDPLEKEMAIHSSIPAWRIPWTEGPGGLQSGGGLKRVRHDWTAFTHFQTLDSSSFKHFLKLNSSPLLFIVYKNGNKGPEILRNCSKIPYGHIKKLGILFCIIRGTCPRQILRTDTTNRSLSTSSLTYGRHC